MANANPPAVTRPAGLEGVVAGDTQICSVEQGALIYRGYEIHDLAENATFEEVAYLLLHSEKPSEDQLETFKLELIAERQLPSFIEDYLKTTATPLKQHTAVPMDILRTAVSMLGTISMHSQATTNRTNLLKAKQLLAKIPTIIGHMQNVLDGRDIVPPSTTMSHAANLLYMITGEEPTAEEERIIDVSLTLYAEHDYNASTFTSRVISATMSDLHGAVTGAIAALKGPLHGGANEAAMEMLKSVDAFVTAGNGSVEDWLSKAFAAKRKLMGFGHRVYKNGDHRAAILMELGRAYAKAKGGDALKWFNYGDEMIRIMRDEKNIHPNVDYPCGMTYYVMGIPVPQYTPIFVAARITGWAAHIMEQHANNRLIRPVSNYVGPAVQPWNG